MNNAIATLLTCLCAFTSAFAQWQLIDDFQAFEDGVFFTDASDIGWHGFAPDGSDEYWMFADPDDTANICMLIGEPFPNPDNSTWMVKELPAGGIPPGATGTIYFRCLWVGFSNNWHIGTADRELAFDPVTGSQTTPGSWEDYNALIRLGDSASLEHRDGSAYVATNPSVLFTVYEWYQFWMVVDNTWDDSSTPPLSTGTHTLYVQGPGFGDGNTPTLVPVGTNPPKDSAFLNRAPTDPNGNPQAIKWIMITRNPMPSGSPSVDTSYLLDDFYFTPGMHLPPPPPPHWWTVYPVNDYGDLDTGDWMGWINVIHAPYFWSYSLNSWIYMEEPAPDSPGAWGYIYK